MVGPILEAVRRRGDQALLEYARRFDGLERRERSRAAAADLERGRGPVPPDSAGRLRQASENIRDFARMQLPEG